MQQMYSVPETDESAGEMYAAPDGMFDTTLCRDYNLFFFTSESTSDTTETNLDTYVIEYAIQVLKARHITVIIFIAEALMDQTLKDFNSLTPH